MPQHFRTALVGATAAALTGGLLTLATSPATASPATATGATATAPAITAPATPGADFNGDGYRDLAVSAPEATVDGRQRAGAITVLYGSPTGISASRTATLSQNSPGIPGAAEADDRFGWATATGDFDADGYADLAVSAPYEDVGSDADGGTVQILWGSPSGLAAGGAGATLADPAPFGHDRFGAALAAGDFDGDGRTDLAVGSDSSAVRIARQGISKSGAPGAGSSVPVPVLGTGSNGVTGLTAGDMTGDGRSDLIVNGYSDTPHNGRHYNANHFLPGGPDGPVGGSAVKRLPAGISSAVGDIDGDGFGDLVSGLPWDGTVPGSSKGGRVNVFFGSAGGPAHRPAAITQESGAIPGSSETDDRFGYEIALGDIDGDGRQDLAIGAAGEDLDGVANAGSVTVLRGSPSGVEFERGVQYVHQGTPGVPGENEQDDHFGGEALLGDLNGDGKADLGTGSIYENAGDGAFVSLLSDGTRTGAAGARALSPSDVGVSTAGAPQFGSVAVG